MFAEDPPAKNELVRCFPKLPPNTDTHEVSHTDFFYHTDVTGRDTTP